MDAGHEGRTELLWSTYAEAATKSEVEMFAAIIPKK